VLTHLSSRSVLKLSSHLSLGLRICLCRVELSVRSLNDIVPSTILVTCSAHLNFLDFYYSDCANCEVPHCEFLSSSYSHFFWKPTSPVFKHPYPMFLSISMYPLFYICLMQCKYLENMTLYETFSPSLSLFPVVLVCLLKTLSCFAVVRVFPRKITCC
jgi:hypothetical protein